jgi:glycosyltransferase involved in cell wall biosynthesis
VLNEESNIASFINNVLSQSETSFDLIIIDGGSTDNTLDILSRYTAANIVFRSSPGASIFAAWNQGLKLSHGEWIVFLGADDRFSAADVLSNIRRDIEASDIIEGVLCYPVNWRGRYYSKIIRPRELSRRTLEGFSMPLAFPGAVFSRGTLASVNFFRETFRLAGDYDLVFRLIMADASFRSQTKVNIIMQGTGVTSTWRGQFTSNVEVIKIRSSLMISPVIPPWGYLIIISSFFKLLVALLARR